MYGLAADLVAFVHGLLIAAAVVGSLANILGLLRQCAPARWALFWLLAFVGVSDLCLGGCPLTKWEKALRELESPGSAYAGSFIGRYCIWMPRWMHSWGAPGVVIGGLLAFPAWWAIDRVKRKRNALLEPPTSAPRT